MDRINPTRYEQKIGLASRVYLGYILQNLIKSGRASIRQNFIPDPTYINKVFIFLSSLNIFI